MELMRLGGAVMWPLLLISIIALALIIERLIVFAGMKVPRGIRAGASKEEALRALADSPCLADYARVLSADRPSEELARNAGDEVLARMQRGLGILGALARIATLLGLLGTVIGMITAFAVIAETTGGIDMSLLAKGLWQALITTATGLSIAIPCYLALAWLESRVDAMARCLTTAGLIALARETRAGE